MHSEASQRSQTVMSASDGCWNRIGVQGDRSCPRLSQAIHCRNCPVFADAGRQLFTREAKPEYLEQWTRQLATVDQSAVGETLSLLVFRIGPEWLALGAGALVEVVEPRPIHRVPHRSDRLLLGLTNIRGELHLCISLGELLGIDLAEGDGRSGSASSTVSRPRLLVAEHDQNRWVFPADDVEGVRRVPVEALENLPHTVERSPRYYSQAIFTDGGRNVGMLSETRLFPALERTVR